MDIKILDKHRAGTEQSFVVLSYRFMLTLLGLIGLGIGLLLTLLHVVEQPDAAPPPELASEVYIGRIETTLPDESLRDESTSKPNKSDATTLARKNTDSKPSTSSSSKNHAAAEHSKLTGSNNGSLWSVSYFHTRHEQSRGPWPNHEEYVELQVNTHLIRGAQEKDKVGIVVPQLKQSFQGRVSDISREDDGEISLSGVLEGYTFRYVFYVSVKDNQIEGVIETPLGDFVLESKQEHIRMIAASEKKQPKADAKQPMIALASTKAGSNTNAPMVREDIYIWEEKKDSDTSKNLATKQNAASDPVQSITNDVVTADGVDSTADYQSDVSADSYYSTYDPNGMDSDFFDPTLDASYATASMYNDYGTRPDPYTSPEYYDTSYDALEADGMSQEANDAMADNIAAANYLEEQTNPSDAVYVQYDADGNPIGNYDGPIEYADPNYIDPNYIDPNLNP